MKRWMGLAMSIVIVAACSSEGGNRSSGSGGSGGDSGGSGGSGASGGSGGSGNVCEGTQPWPEGTDTCHNDAECMYGCSAYSDAGGCGACDAPQHECEMDIDCGMGFVCHSYPWSSVCPCNGGESTERRCQAACPATSCGPDDTCDDVTGWCNPTACDAGFTCPTGQTCDMVPWSDQHGCRPLDCMEGAECSPIADCVATPQGYQCLAQTCDVDGDCACGACVNGQCAPRIGACYEPAA
jgi:hypothetical protein